jgi:uncharacterized protein
MKAIVLLLATAFPLFGQLSDLISRAEAGDATAQCLVGVKYQNGEGAPKNFSTANYWLMKSAAQGSPTAQFHLATAYDKGLGVRRDAVMANQIFNKLANEGDANAQIALALHFLRLGNGTERRQSDEKSAYQTNLVLACKWFTLARTAGGIPAKLATEHLEETYAYMSEQSVHAAQIMAANFSPNPPSPLIFGGRPAASSDQSKQSETDQKLLHWQFQQASNGSPRHQYELGVRYFKGDGVESNSNLSMQWLNHAAAQDYSPAISFKTNFTGDAKGTNTNAPLFVR